MSRLHREVEYRHPPDGLVLDALADDIARWYRAEAERDVKGMLRVAYRLQHRRAEVDTLRDDVRWVKADADLVPVETAMADLEPAYTVTGPVLDPSPGWDDETHWGRWWPTYLGVTAAAVGVVVVLWVVTALVAALAAALAALVPALLGVLGVVALIVLLGALGGGGGGRGFTFSGSGRLH